MKDITGQKFGMLTVIEQDRSFCSPKYTKWICKCDCGNVKSINRNSLIQGRTKSCGCEQYKNKSGINAIHGMSKTRIYHEWVSMRRRCKPNANDSKNYFERGITVCDEWNADFLSFYNWAMETGYDDSLTIDRINNNEGYFPQNCRWVSIEAQQSNKTNTVYINYNGGQYCLRQLCAKLNFPYKTAHRRYKRMIKKQGSVNIEKLFEPVHAEKIAFKYRNLG